MKVLMRKNYKKIWRDRYNLDDFKVTLDLKKHSDYIPKDHNNNNLIKYAKKIA